MRRSNTLGLVIASFEAMATDEGGPDGTWDRGETHVILEELRAAEPNNEEEGVRSLVNFLTTRLE